jgi:hypothetical protein
VRRGDAVLGLYPAPQVARYVLLGRLRLTDEVSADRERWQRLGARPDLLPSAVVEGADEEVLLRLRMREDERAGGDRRSGPPPCPELAERRSGVERRRPEPTSVLRHRERRRRLLAGLRSGSGPRGSRPWAWLVGLSLLVVGLGLLASRGSTPDRARCVSGPGPGVDWRDCRLDGLDLSGLDLSRGRLRDVKARGVRLTGARLAGVDLAYSDLTGARLARADLSGASLVGANLRGADLRDADLRDANLAYSDLHSARLDGARLDRARLERALWADGRLCGPGSVGRCAGAP